MLRSLEELHGDGYPMHGCDTGRASSAMADDNASGAVAYRRARRCHDVRTVPESAQILGQRGQRNACQALLGEMRGIYGRLAAELRIGDLPKRDAGSCRYTQQAATGPVASYSVSYCWYQRIDTEVLNPKGEESGSVPVPWASFNLTAGAKKLVLETKKPEMAAAPQVRTDRCFARHHFDQQSQQVDRYGSAHDQARLPARA